MFATDLFTSEFVPASRRSSHLMIVLHGKGDSLRPFREFHQELRLSKLNLLLLNAPRKYLSGYSWYGDPPFQKFAVPQIREKLNGLMDELAAAGWSPRKTFVFGFSQGCLVGADLVLHRGETLAGFVGVSGYFHFYPRWRAALEPLSHKTPWLLVHGDKDKVLPPDDTFHGVRKLRQIGVPIDWRVLPGGHSLNGQMLRAISGWLKPRLI